jgi:cytochrome c oxidase assembly protein subunit 15
MTGSILISLGVWAAASAKPAARRRLRLAGRLLVLAVVLQISIGIATVHWGVPLPLATLHNAGAAFLVICMVTLLRTLWPAPATGVIPLNRADPPR